MTYKYLKTKAKTIHRGKRRGEMVQIKSTRKKIRKESQGMKRSIKVATTNNLQKITNRTHKDQNVTKIVENRTTKSENPKNKKP